MIVYEFLYNGSCCESAAHTVSIHRTRRGAEIAMEFHRNEMKNEYDELMRGMMMKNIKKNSLTILTNGGESGKPNYKIK